MKFNPNVNPLDVIKKGAFDGTYLETFILMLSVNFIKIVGKNLKN